LSRLSKSDDMKVLDSSWLCEVAGLAAACVKLMKLHDIGQHIRTHVEIGCSTTNRAIHEN
jgi:hypothetical protein